MLDFIFGAAKSGKTTRIYEKIKALCEKGEQHIYYFAPEQFALEAETSLFSYLGSRLFLNVTVTSFSRVSQDIFKEYGRLAGRYINECSKLLIMSRAIDQVKEELVLYKKSSKYPSFAKTMLQAVEEFKNAGVTSEMLYEKIDVSSDDGLKNKLSEISKLYMVYDALVAASGIDKADDMERSCDLLRTNTFFENSIIFIDEFKGFTGIELKMLKFMLIQSKSVCVALCFDQERSNEYKNSPFASVQKTYLSLVKTARQVSVSVSVPTKLENTFFETKATAWLEKHIFSPSTPTFESLNESVFAVSCKNEYDEADFVLSMIRELVNKKGYKYSDIAIIARDTSAYSSIFHSGCKKYGVSYYDDYVDNVAHKPIMRFVNAALCCVSKGMSSENVLNLLKCNMTSFSIEEIADFENYLYVWDISSKHWGNEFEGNPQGFRGEITDTDKDKLININKIREFVVNAISRFKEDIEKSNGSGKELCRAVVGLLNNLSVRKTTQNIIEDLLKQERFEEAEDYKRSFEVLMEILDSMAAVLDKMPIKTEKFLELFLLSAKEYDMGTVPQSVDSVLIGDAARIRTINKKVIFVVGANENVFPPLPRQSGLFSDRERKELSDIEIEISPPVIDKINEERFIAYKALTSPSKLLFVTESKADISGVLKAPSQIIYQLISLFGEGVLSDSGSNIYNDEFYCKTKKAAFSRLAPNTFNENTFWATLKNTLGNDESYKQRLLKLSLIREEAPFEITDSASTKALFGTQMYISPTRVETFYRCAFRYFCEHGLRVLPLRKAELDPMEAGTLIHMVLELVISQIDFKKDFDEKQVVTLINTVLDQYISEVMGGEKTKSKRFLYLYRRMSISLFELVKRLYDELSKSEFSPFDFEYDIDQNSDITPLKLLGENGQTVYVSGKVDRIDCYKAPTGEKYIRIVDYKSGQKEFRLDEVLYGLNLQMLIYLHCIEKNGKGKYENSLPAGILYMPSGEKRGNLSRTANVHDIDNEKKKAYRMNGLLINSPEIITAMENPCDGVFIPVATKNDGSFNSRSASALISLANLGKVNNYIEQLIIDMSDELIKGKIEALPFDKSCDICGYSAVCGKKNNTKKREYIKLDTNEDIVKVMTDGFGALEKIGEGDENDGD